MCGVCVCKNAPYLFQFDEFKNHEIAILKASLESRISELPGQVDELRSSLEPEVTAPVSAMMQF